MKILKIPTPDVTKIKQETNNRPSSFGETKLTPWQAKPTTTTLAEVYGDNPFGITKSGVDFQDEPTLEDLADNPSLVWDKSNLASIMKNTGMQLLSNTYVGQVSNMIGKNLNGNNSGQSIRPEGTTEEASDELATQIRKIKEEKYKTVRLTTKLGQYNSVMNLLGNASGMFVGTLGKSAIGNFADDGLKIALQSLPFGFLATNATTIIERIGRSIKNGGEGVLSSMSSVSLEDLVKLTAANYYTILSLKPGLTIRNYRKNSLNYVTNDSASDASLGADIAEPSNWSSKKTGDGNRVIDQRKEGYEVEVGDYNDEDGIIDGENLIQTSFNSITESFDEVTKNTEREGLQEAEAITKEYMAPKKSNAEITVDEDYEWSKAFIPNMSRDIMPVEFVTGRSEIGGEAELISLEALEEYKKRYTFLQEGKDGLREFNTTGVKYKFSMMNGLSIVPSYLPKKTDIVSGLRKEVDIGYGRQNFQGNINDFDYSPEELGIIENELKNGGNVFPGPRVAKSFVYKRVNSTFREIGALYVEPFYNGGMLQSFEIPFEFNPEFSSDGHTAEYTINQVMGRILPIKQYTSTDSKDLTITTTYIALSPDDKKFINNDYWHNGWMLDWTPQALKKIENNYRALTMPFIYKANFVRPPIIRVKMRPESRNDIEGMGQSLENKKVSDLFSYPSLGGDENSDINNEEKIQITSKFDTQTREKRYIAKDVTIAPLEDSYGFGNSYGILSEGGNVYARRGFKVTLVLTETTKNFLDLIPSYGQYIANGGDIDYPEYKGDTTEFDIGVMDSLEFDVLCKNEQNTSIDLNSINTYKGGVEKGKKDGFLTILSYDTGANFTDDDINNAADMNIEDDPLFDIMNEENRRKSFEVYKNEYIQRASAKEFIQKASFEPFYLAKAAFNNWLFPSTLKNLEKALKEYNDWNTVVSALEGGYTKAEIVKKSWSSAWYKNQGYKDWIVKLVASSEGANVLFENHIQFKNYLIFMDCEKKDSFENLVKYFGKSAYFNKNNTYGFVSWLKGEGGNGSRSLFENWDEILSSILPLCDNNCCVVDKLFGDTWGESSIAVGNGYAKYMFDVAKQPEAMIERLGVNGLASLYESYGKISNKEYYKVVQVVSKAVRNTPDIASENSMIFSEFQQFLSELASRQEFYLTVEQNKNDNSAVSFLKNNILPDASLAILGEAVSKYSSITYNGNENIMKILKEAGFVDGEIRKVLKNTNWSHNDEFKLISSETEISCNDGVEEKFGAEIQWYKSNNNNNNNNNKIEEDNTDLEIDGYWKNAWDDGLRENNFFLMLYERTVEDENTFECENDNDD